MNKHQRFIDLGWEILEHKWCYYIGVGFDVTPIIDEAYDKIEQEYIALAKELNLEEYSNAVGFPIERPSGKLVDQKMRQKYGIK